MLSLSVFSLPFRFLSSASLPVLATQPSVSSFPLSSRLRLTLAFSVRPLRFRFLGFPHSLRPGFPCFSSVSKYLAFCSFPFILPGFAPTAVPPVLPLCSRFRAFSLSVAFFRPLWFGSNYSAFRSFFSLLPVFPCRRFLRCCLVALRLPRFSSSVWPVAMPYFRLWYSAYCASFYRSLSRLTVATSASWPSLAGFGLFPFAYALGSGYSASGFLPFGFFLFAVSLGNV